MASKKQNKGKHPPLTQQEESSDAEKTVYADEVSLDELMLQLESDPDTIDFVLGVDSNLYQELFNNIYDVVAAAHARLKTQAALDQHSGPLHRIVVMNALASIVHKVVVTILEKTLEECRGTPFDSLKLWSCFRQSFKVS